MTVKKLSYLAGIVFLLSCFFQLAVFAQSPRGSITISQSYEGEVRAGGDLKLYQVASLQEGNMVSTPVFADVAATMDLSASSIAVNNRNYSQQLKQLALASSPLQEVADIPLSGVKFEDLEAGVYLIIQTKSEDGFEPLSPVLVALPTDDNYILSATEKMSLKKETTPSTVIDDSKVKKQMELPFTGQLWWPIPVLFVVGMACIYASRKKRG